MKGGITGEAGKAVGAAINVFKHEPLVLSLMIMNFALIGFVYFQSSSFNAQRKDNIALFVQVQTEVQKLLSQCIIPAPPDRRGELSLPLRLTSDSVPPP